MHKALMAALGLSVLLTAPAAGATRDEARKVAPFTKVVARGSYTIDIRERADQLVILTAEPRDLDRVKTWVEDNTLYIEKKRWRQVGRVHLTIDVAHFEGLVVQGLADARVTGVADHDVTFELQGTGEIQASGTCGSVAIEIKGAGNVDTRGLACQRAEVELMGAADAVVHAEEEVVLTILGSGRVDIHGDPGRVLPNRIAGTASVNLR